MGGGSSEWQSYVTKLDGSTVQANSETADAARFVDNGDGTYQYTFAQALTAYTGAPTYNARSRIASVWRCATTRPPTMRPSISFLPAAQ